MYIDISYLYILDWDITYLLVLIQDMTYLYYNMRRELYLIKLVSEMAQLGSCIPPSVIFPGDEVLCSTSTGASLLDYWCNNDCIATYSSLLNTAPDGSLGYNSSNLGRVQNDVSTLFSSYLQTYDITSSVTDPRYNPFQEVLLGMCRDPRLPGACDQFLSTQFCIGLSREEMGSDTTLAAFCGCYAPADTLYLPYTEDKACDPLCHRAQTVQLADPGTGEIERCSNSICVIDDVTINIANSTVGGVNFTQICGGCGTTGASGATGPPATCECIISGVNLTETLSSIGVGNQFNQLCGPDSVCLQLGSDGSATPVPCSSIDPNPSVPNFPTYIPTIFIVIAVVVILIVLFGMLATYK